MRVLTMAAKTVMVMVTGMGVAMADAKSDQGQDPDLFEWIRANGGYVNPKQELSTGPDPDQHLRGIFATEQIERDEVILKVPWSLAIHPGSPGSVPFDEATMPDTPGMSMSCMSVEAIRREMAKGVESTYWPYLAVMEEHEINIPNVWTENERKVLLGSLFPAGREATRHIDWWTGSCGGSYDDEIGVRAALLYVARSCSTSIYGEAMVPVYDLYNHRNGGYHNTEVEVTQDFFVMNARHTISAGEQLYNSYGSKSSEIFRDYGFVEDHPQVWWVTDSRDGKQHEFTIEDENGTITWDTSWTQPVVGPGFRSGARKLLEVIKTVDESAEREKNSAYYNLAAAYRAAYQRAVQIALRSSLDESKSRGEEHEDNGEL